MRILYTSLFPKEPVQHEYENLDFFVKSSKFYDIDSVFSYTLFSAHKEPMEFIKKKHKFDCHVLDFNYTENMSERRGHEISFCKSKILSHNIDMADEYDYLFFTDSDIRLDSKEIYELCQLLEVSKKDMFVNIPYALRDLQAVSDASFGCYIIPTEILKNNDDLWTVIYNTKEIDGVLHRIGAPDCNVRNNLIVRGYHELRALSANTRHYTDNTHYVEYDQGTIKVF